jgi:hypothetical protein
MVNDPATVFVRRHRGPSGYHDEVFHDDDHVLRTLTKLLDDASSAHRKLDPADGLQDAQLDDGARVHIVHGDVARGGHVLVNIRKFTGVQFSPDLRDRVADGTITVSYRLWSRPKVKVGGVYRSGSVMIEIDEIELLPFSSITNEDLARTGEPDVETIRRRAAHAGPIHDDTVRYRVEFHVVRQPDNTSS